MDSALFGPYRLVEVLSSGPSAIVYRAHDTSHDGREVALKVFGRQLAGDPAFRERFRHDAGLVSALREPHVVPIHRYGEIDGAPFVDMRLVRGTTLAEALRAGPLDPTVVRTVGQQVGAAGEALLRGGLGNRPLGRDEVLLTGPPGREFVQLVGLGLGRPPVATPPRIDELLGLQPGWRPPAPQPQPQPRPRRRRLGAVAAVLTVLAVLAAALVVVRSGWGWSDPPVAPGPPGLVASIADTGGASAAATGELDGRRVLVAAAVDGGIRIWDLTTGEQVRPPIPGTAFTVETTTLDGRTVVVAYNRDTTLSVFDLATGAPVGTTVGTPDPDGRSGGAVLVLPLLALPDLDGAPVAITQQETGATVAGPAGTPVPQVGLQARTLPDGRPVGPVMAGDGQSVGRYSVTEIDGRPVVVSTEGGTGIQVHDLATGARTAVPIPPQPAGLTAITTTERDGTPVAVTGGADNAVRIWDLRTGEQAGSPMLGHTGRVIQLEIVRLGTRTVVVSASMADPGTEIRFWDLGTGEPIGGPLTAHPLAESFTATADGAPPLFVSAPRGGPITVWDAQKLIEGGAS
ncbi:protein kinase family protein [Pseudonocardia sp. DLS-67]